MHRVSPASSRNPLAEAGCAPAHNKRQASHSHSIVSGTYKQLQLQDFLSRYAWLTVKSTARTFRLGTVDGDRCRKDGRGVMEYLKKTEIAALVARDRSICGGVGAVNPPSPNQ